MTILRQAIMHRSRLKNVVNKSQTPNTWDSHKKQPKFCVNLFRTTKKNTLKISRHLLLMLDVN